MIQSLLWGPAGKHRCNASLPAGIGLADGLYGTVRLLLAALFAYAGARKLADPAAFAVVIEGFGMMPPGWIGPLSVMLPWVEIVAAVGLAVEIRGSLAGVGLLLGFFIAVLAYGIWLGLDVDCGCFGPEDPEGRAFAGMRVALYRDLAMAAAVVLLYGWRWFRGIEPVGPAAMLRRFKKGQIGENEDGIRQTGHRVCGGGCHGAVGGGSPAGPEQVRGRGGEGDRGRQTGP